MTDDLDRPAPLPQDWRQLARSPLVHLQVLVVLAVLLGGGGAAYGFRNLAIQLFALLLLAAHGGLVAQFVREAPLGLRVLLAATVALPLLQLVPLPPAVWQALPGRETVLASHTLAGFGDGRWFPASLDRGRTLVAATSLIVPATLVVLGALLPAEDKRRLAITVVAAGIGMVLIGAVQLQTANASGLFYPINPNRDVLYATFANRNSTGLFLVIAACLAVSVPESARSRMLVPAAVAVVLLVIGTVLTQSRSSMVLLVLPLLFLLFRLVAYAFRRSRNLPTSLASAGALAALLAVAAGGALAVSAVQGGRVAESLARFEDQRTDRPEMWEDGLYAAQQYWPLGSGTGTFDEVFQLYESLEYVSPRRAGRAHSDWIELAMESGLIGLALALAWLAWCGRAAFLHLRYGQWWPGVGAGIGVAVLAAQSLIDYPLRNQTMLCLAGVLVLLLARKWERRLA